ncbi:site-specific integrase [Mucilaginibacter limnophilus]|uniref:Site-specific integrase n=1 Tax=Mucilaginibacter limnophilus TaxID=1932778 RepID=A0A437MTT5_9SPHI|nr:site-specific integrase [Mucilaginibacter limnophilus]RVU01072.1 site-specific integrase [Mucilaginibacter limnophilus]
MNNSGDMYNFSVKLWYNKKRIAANGLASLYLQVILNSRHKEFPLKLKWPADRIDLAAGTLLPKKRGDQEVNDLNMIILDTMGKYNEVVIRYRMKQAPIDLVTFTREVTTGDKKANLVSWMRNEIVIRYKRKEIGKRSYLNHNSAVAAMEAFDKCWPFDQLDVKWMKRFKTHLVAEGYSPGGVWSIIKSLKAYLQFSRLEPMLHVDEAVAGFPNPLPTWNTTFLTKDEVRLLIILLRSGNLLDTELTVLRAFLFQCFTSLRISDVYRVNAKWQLSDGYLDFIPKKNEKKGKWVHVPIMPMAMNFVSNTLDKYFELPNEAEYNEKLKAIARKAGIKKRLTSHVGRHTYGYLFMTTMGNLKALQEIMGHSKLDTTTRYAHLDDEYKTASVNKIQEGFNDLFVKRKPR